MIKLENRTYYRALGIRISQLRKDRNMTQAELARILGVSQQTVFAYELGDRRVTVSILPRLAEVFDISVEELIGINKPLRTKKQSVSPHLLFSARRIQQLPKSEQRFILKLIDYVAERHGA